MTKALPQETIALLQEHLQCSLQILACTMHQALHGDAHLGNVMMTTQGLLWTDWEDAFAGPIEWDIASVIWNAQLIEQDHLTVEGILRAYQAEGHVPDPTCLQQCLVARAAVMSAWYPILYPNPSADRREKLAKRIHWLEQQR